MKRLLLWSWPLLAAIGCLPAVAGDAWLLPTGYPAAYFQTQNVARFADDVAAATAGRLRIEVRPGGQLLPLAQIRPAVEAGSVPLAEFNLSAEAAVDPAFGLDALPFVAQSYEDAELLWTISRPLVERALRRRGLVLLYAVPWPPQGLYAGSPLARVGDLKGQRLRSYNPATMQLARLLGAQPVEVPLVDLRAALAEKRVDLLLTSATSGVEVRAWEFLKHYYDVRAWYPKNVVVANAQALAALPAADRQALLDAAAAAERRGWQASRSQDGADRGQLAAHGLRVDNVSPEFAAALQRAGESLVRAYLRSAGSDVLDVLLAYNLRRPPGR
ncbi:MAG: TRAP transporter substrate-binding protein [Rhodocyclales bacterium]|nr:TRAP transporter substrate-binding protein [Rhodocyclales bacterium]